LLRRHAAARGSKVAYRDAQASVTYAELLERTARLAGHFADLGIAGAIPSKNRRAGGTDSSSFSQAGLPGIGLGQDPIEYFTDTWHTNLDTYERIIEDDVKKDAIVVAASIYQLAMRDNMLPRFTAADMPAKPEPAGAQTAAAPAGGSTAQPTPASGAVQQERVPATPKK
jgi:non-ribosomal peptide synthetase component E (peptide arylation enzyme)